MRKTEIKIVIGANFGDEGKGLMTDYFCSKLAETHDAILNIRHNGGAQAGHNVVTPDGKQHVFQHFGAGSFVDGVSTYLSEDFILNPIIFCRELKELQKLGLNPKVYVSKNCRITTPYDMIANQVIETMRGEKRHGSCGLGIDETVKRNQGTFSFRVNDILKSSIDTIHCVVNNIQRNYVMLRLREHGLERVIEPYRSYVNSDIIFHNYLAQLQEMMRNVIAVDDSILNGYSAIVFEGAQGLLLDQDNFIFAPHLTSSKTGSYNPKKMIIGCELQKKSIEVCYVTRPYFTRHGAGLFPSECEKSDILSKDIVDKHNTTNEFQGALRYGYFDSNLFSTMTIADTTQLMIGLEDTHARVAITHLDETEDRLCIKYPLSIANSIPNTRYRSYGETRKDVKEVDW